MYIYINVYIICEKHTFEQCFHREREATKDYEKRKTALLVYHEVSRLAQAAGLWNVTRADVLIKWVGDLGAQNRILAKEKRRFQAELLLAIGGKGEDL